MKTYLYTLTILLTTLSSIGYAYSQNRNTPAPRLEELPRNPVDTVATADPDTFIIIFSNNTWVYYRPDLSRRLEDLPVYTENWDTTHIFSYRNIQIEDLPQTIDLNLIASLGDFHYPIKGKVFSKYGPRGRRNHNGVDIPLKIGEPIYSTFDGRVRYAGWNNGGYGNLVIVRHENGLETWHAHLSKCNVTAGEFVKAGQIIGFGGNTGRSRGPHLHYEVRYCDQTFDPEHLLDFENGRIKYMTFALERSFFNIRSRASDELEEHDFDDYAAHFAAEGVTSEDIINHISNPQRSSGSGNASVTSSDAVYHTIKSGDILGKISRQYGVSIDQICRLNNITRTTTLRIGRKLRVK